MTTNAKLLHGLVQVFTRRTTSGVVVRISDGGPIPSFDVEISRPEFIELLKESGLSTLSIRSLVDLGTLYYSEIKEVLDKEMARRKATEPDFKKRFTKEVLPRLRDGDNPDWRYQSD